MGMRAGGFPDAAGGFYGQVAGQVGEGGGGQEEEERGAPAEGGEMDYEQQAREREARF